MRGAALSQDLQVYANGKHIMEYVPTFAKWIGLLSIYKINSSQRNSIIPIKHSHGLCWLSLADTNEHPFPLISLWRGQLWSGLEAGSLTDVSLCSWKSKCMVVLWLWEEPGLCKHCSTHWIPPRACSTEQLYPLTYSEYQLQALSSLSQPPDKGWKQ